MVLEELKMHFSFDYTTKFHALAAEFTFFLLPTERDLSFRPVALNPMNKINRLEVPKLRNFTDLRYVNEACNTEALQFVTTK